MRKPLLLGFVRSFYTLIPHVLVQGSRKRKKMPDNRFNLIFHGMAGIIRSKSTAGWAPLATDTGLQGMYLWSLSELNTRQLIQSNADKQAVVTSLLNGERILVDGNVKCGGDPTSCGAVSGP